MLDGSGGYGPDLTGGYGGKALASIPSGYQQLGSTGISNWTPGPEHRRNRSPVRDQHLDIWTRLLQQPFSATGVGHGFLPHQASTAPMAPIFPALSTYFIECFVKAGSANGPEAWLTLLQTWVGVLETKSFIAPAATKQPGATMLEYRLEGPIAEARIPSAAIVAAFTEGYQRVATSLYGSHYKIDFWAVLTTLPLSVMASTGCAVADIMIDLCSAAGHLPKVSDQHRQESLWMRLQSTQTVAGAKGSKEPHLTGRVPTDLLMDSQMLEEITVEFQRSRPAKVVQFLESLDQKNFAAVLYAMQLCQQHDCPKAIRKGIMFYMQRKTLHMYTDLQSFANFQDGRMRLAMQILRLKGLSQSDNRLFALALCRPALAGMRSFVPASHRISTTYKNDKQLTFEDQMLVLDREMEVISEYGLTIIQPAADYAHFIAEMRLIHDELGSAEATIKGVTLVVTDRLRELIVDLFKFRAKLVLKYADEYIGMDVPYPSLYTASHLRSAFAHDPCFRDDLDSLVARARKELENDRNPVRAVVASATQDTKGLEKMQASIASLTRTLATLTKATAATGSQHQRDTAAAATKAASALMKQATAAAATAKKITLIPIIDSKKNKKGNPSPPTVDPPEPGAVVTFDEVVKGRTIPKVGKGGRGGGGGGGGGNGFPGAQPDVNPPLIRFRSKGLATAEQSTKWDHPPIVLTPTTNMAVPFSLFWDYCHDAKETGKLRDKCFFDMTAVGRGCSKPTTCFQHGDGVTLKEHPNGDDQAARDKSRAKLVEQCALCVDKGYLGPHNA